jgi:hypothetical protein
MFVKFARYPALSHHEPSFRANGCLHLVQTELPLFGTVPTTKEEQGPTGFIHNFLVCVNWLQCLSNLHGILHFRIMSPYSEKKAVFTWSKQSCHGLGHSPLLSRSQSQPGLCITSLYSSTCNNVYKICTESCISAS